MAMLAEKKKRQKWCANPRGKAWSDDQSKFGQKLLEKMGWSAGQGLGVNNQGPTEIVHVRKKDNNNGLGFKENGEEWLKTTSDFNDLLENLGNGSDEGGKEKTDATSSLEDRSKKSKARVHYHKFTRGKDLSRYSKKDLASIIGPDIVKPNSEDENKDYSSNQINKGSCVDYFNAKKQLNGTIPPQVEDNSSLQAEIITKEEKLIKKAKKSKWNKEHVIDENLGLHTELSGNIPNNIEGDTNSIYQNPETKCEEEISNINKMENNKNKRKKKSTPENEEEANSEGIINVNNDKKHSKSKKRKFEEHITYNQAEECISTYDVDERKQKKSKTNKNELSEIQNESDEQFCETSEVYNTVIEKVSKRRKSKHIGENFEMKNATENNDSAEKYDNMESDIVCKKKKKKKQNNDVSLSNEETSIEEAEGGVITDSINSCDIEQDRDKKKRKKNKPEHLSEIEVEGVQEINTVIDRASKKRKRKCLVDESNSQTETEIANIHKSKKNKNKEKNNNKIEEIKEKGSVKFAEESCQGNEIEDSICYDGDVKTKKKKSKKAKEAAESHEITDSKDVFQNNQNNLTKPNDCIGIQGRKTRLKKILSYIKPENNIKYETDDFMSFDSNKIDSILSDNIKQERLDHSNSKIEFDANTADGPIKINVKPNDIDCNVAKHVVAFEYRQITAKFKKLGLMAPEVKVIIKKAQNLSQATRKKLKIFHKSRVFKTFLPKSDLAEIETLVKRFSEGLQPKINMINTIEEIESKTAHIAEKLTEDVKTEEVKDYNSIALKPDKLEVLKNMSQQLQMLMEVKTEKGTTADKHVVPEVVGKGNRIDHDYPQGPADKLDCKPNSLQKRLDDRLKVLAEQMKMLVEGKKPMNLIHSASNQGRGWPNTRGTFGRQSYHQFSDTYKTNQNVRGRGGFMNRRGRGSFQSHQQMCSQVQSGNQNSSLDKLSFITESFVRGRAFTHFSSRGRLGRGFSRGRGMKDLRGRGRISQNNFDAKLYAEKCKALNKTPELAFRGVDLKNISGYASNLINDQNNSGNKTKSSPVTSAEQENITKKSSTLLDVIVNKEKTNLT